jgi:antitoxin (DNA-binding transcriptional repressor) of toxin-antitoxin stability system
MTVFTYSQARQNFSSVLEKASNDGEVQIRRKDGSLYVIAPIKQSKQSPLDVKGVSTKASTRDIISAIRECRER